MTTRQCFPRGTRRLALFPLVMLVLWAAPTRAAAQGSFKILFSRAADSKTAVEALLLRPNQVQDYFVFVKNDSDKDEMVTLDIVAGGNVVEGGSVSYKANAKETTLFSFGKPAAEKPVPPAPPDKAPAPEKAPPQFVDLAGQVQFVLHGKDAAGKRVELGKPVYPAGAKPSTYVAVTLQEYDRRPQAGGKIKNQLRITVRATTDIQGGKCRVDLVLDPARIPGLVDAKKEGTRSAYLEHAGDEATLTANNLQFQDVPGTGSDKEDGFVYLTIDGYERAAIFKATFPRTGETTRRLDREDSRVFVRLKAPRVADPGRPYPVDVELDNTDAKNVLEIGLNRDGDPEKKFKRTAGELLTLGNGDRQERLSLNPAFPGGALQLKRTVTDWSTELPVAGINGPRELRVRLLQAKEEFTKDNPALVKFVNSADGPGDTTIEAVTQVVLFDGVKPQDLRFVDFPQTLVRGAALPVKALVVPPDSGIKEVLFYVGKPGADGKMPPNAASAAGTLADPKTNLYAAALDAPTDQKGKTDVTAQVTSNTGVVATETVTIKLVDAGPGGGGAGKGTIEGKVVQGDRPQPKVPVFLRDAAGGVKDTTVTDDKGAFIFKDVPPATYRVFASKTGDNTKGETIVQVLEGQKKTDVAVSLVR